MQAGSISPRRLVALLPADWRRRPAYRALADSVRRLVLDGQLPPGTRLPGERSLAQALAVSRTTVSEAYARLRAEGFLTGRQGAASTITVPSHARSRTRGSAHATSLGLTPSDASLRLPGGPSGGDDLDLAVAAPEAAPGIGSAVEAAVAALPAYLGGHGYTPAGLPVLREAVAARYTARGLPTAPEQILVTGGALQAFALVLQVFTSPGDRALVEHPTYPNALGVLRARSVRPVPFPVDPSGWDLERLDAVLRQTAPRLAYLIPDFQNPTGLLLPAADRAALVEILRRTGTLAVVDETLVELALDVPESAMPGPLPAYGGAADDLIAIGSASKAYWGGLGIGWLRAPAHLIGALSAARVTHDLGPALPAQLAVAELIGRREPILAERRSMLRARREALAAAVADQLPDWRFTPPAGGLALWCELPEPVATSVALRVEQHRVRLAPGPRFGVDGAFERFVRLPFTLPEPVLVEAVRRLAIAYAEVGNGAAARRGLTVA